MYNIPHYGAIIESLFGTINREVIHNIWGTTKSNIVERGDLEPEKEAFLTIKRAKEDTYSLPGRYLPLQTTQRVTA